LADDALWVDTTQATCAQYLGGEEGALLGQAVGDCGGFTLTENAMDVTYNALAGTLGAAAGGGALTNGVTVPASAPGSGFPYLAAAH